MKFNIQVNKVTHAPSWATTQEIAHKYFLRWGTPRLHQMKSEPNISEQLKSKMLKDDE